MSSRRAVPLTFLRRLVLPPKTQLSLVFATDPKNLSVSPLLATLPKMASRKSFTCHTCETPGGTPSPVPFTQNGLLALSLPKPKTYNPSENLLRKDEKQLLLLANVAANEGFVFSLLKLGTYNL